MSLYSAMRSGVSGMAAQSSRLAAISDNISNSQTVGYKRAAVDFSTLVTSPGARSTYTASGVQSTTHYKVQQDGTILGTGSTTDMAISGDGFFVVGNKSSGTPEYSLTRAGSFLPDESGFLRNNAGQYLEAWKLNPDGTLPNVSTARFDDLQSVNIGNLVYGGSKTTTMNFSGNLPAQAAAGDSFTTSPTFYDPLGNALDLSLTWTKGATPNEWTLTATGPAGYTVGGAPLTLTFAATGPNAGKPVDGAGLPLDPMPGITVTSPATPTADSFTMSLGNLTQLNGDYVPTVTRDGAKVGQVTSVDIDDGGKLWVLYDNGARQALYQIPVATVTNPDGLVAQDGNTFVLGSDTGTLTLGPGKQGGAGTVVGGALEQSNVDIATELVSLIETQRAYSSNATLVRTTDELVEETTRLKR
ncbi:flagellar hook protein FlgE [Azospirillum lipoferum]|uniref:Flagellar hook protein FlgE n=1 Tax=Azospirillum lipoferum (strain 4B) TaxID=862719 RepID=G7ZHZ2_AZOL4|nr:flagellar hook protein FlgE [Azospirillum lipoferum]CBS91021.1 flagellar hook protein FlgE [Azospirillum lipoferum 4B]